MHYIAYIMLQYVCITGLAACVWGGEEGGGECRLDYAPAPISFHMSLPLRLYNSSSVCGRVVFGVPTKGAQCVSLFTFTLSPFENFLVQ